MSKKNPLDLGTVIDALYAGEINFSITVLWDGGMMVKLGDELNGFLVEQECRNAFEAAEFLDAAARQHFPESSYVLGREDWKQRTDPSEERHKNN